MSSNLHACCGLGCMLSVRKYMQNKQTKQEKVGDTWKQKQKMFLWTLPGPYFRFHQNPFFPGFPFPLCPFSPSLKQEPFARPGSQGQSPVNLKHYSLPRASIANQSQYTSLRAWARLASSSLHRAPGSQFSTIGVGTNIETAAPGQHCLPMMILSVF